MRLCGYGNGGDRKAQAQNGHVLTLDEIAKQLGTSKTNLKRALSIERNLTDSMKELLDTGVITKTLASDLIASLSEEEQEELVLKLDVTKKEVQKYIDEIKKLEEENENLKSQNTSSNNSTIVTLQIEKEHLERENKILEEQKKISDDLAAKYKKQSDEYMRLQKNVSHMGIEPDGDYNTVQAITQISNLNEELLDLLQNRLAPLKYQSYIFIIKDNEVLKENLLNTLNMLNEWYLTMVSYLGEESNYKEIIEIRMEE